MDYSLIIIIALAIIGLLIGFLVSLAGGAGGVFYVPILILAFGVDARVAVATSLATMLPTAIIGSLSHRKEGNLNLKVGLIFGIPGLFGALFGVFFWNQIPTGVLEKIIGVVLIILSISMLFTVIKRIKSLNKTKEDKTQDKTQVEKASGANAKITPKLLGYRSLLAIVFGFMAGLMAGLLGMSGLSFVVLGLYFLGFSASTVIGTTVFVLLFNTAGALFGYITFGQFDLILMLILAISACIGAFIAPKILKKIKSDIIEKLYGPIYVVVLIIFGLSLLF